MLWFWDLICISDQERSVIAVSFNYILSLKPNLYVDTNAGLEEKIWHDCYCFIL